MRDFSPCLTPWHITFGTYGARLHGGVRPTVDKTHNELDKPFLEKNRAREDSARGRMKFAPIQLALEQRRFIECVIPSITKRGGWSLRTCAAGPNHVHVVLDVNASVHGEQVRRLIKRWLGQELNKKWPLSDSASWWAEEGSNLAIHELSYLNNAYHYVFRQRTS